MSLFVWRVALGPRSVRAFLCLPSWLPLLVLRRLGRLSVCRTDGFRSALIEPCQNNGQNVFFHGRVLARTLACVCVCVRESSVSWFAGMRLCGTMCGASITWVWKIAALHCQRGRFHRHPTMSSLPPPPPPLPLARRAPVNRRLVPSLAPPLHAPNTHGRICVLRVGHGHELGVHMHSHRAHQPVAHMHCIRHSALIHKNVHTFGTVDTIWPRGERVYPSDNQHIC